ncbi:MAG: M20 family metallopeptidase [Acidobacteriota bacterium]
MSATRFLDYCRQQERWLLDTVIQLVRLESPTDDKAAVDRCGAMLADLLAGSGGRVTRLPSPTAGDHLKAEFGDGPTQVLLLGHFDTVWPVGQIGRMPVETSGGRLTGPGVLDMKAGIALGLLATRAVLAAGAPRTCRITMLWTTDEETGSRTSREHVEAEARRSLAVLVLEPALASGALKTSRKGCGEFLIEAHGVAAHAGVDPGKGVSAIRELARQVLAVETLQDLDRGVSVNVGLVHGGTRPNVVAEHAAARVDVRAPTMADAARVEAAMLALTPHLPGARVAVTGGFERPPMERSDGVAWLYEIARDVGAELGQQVTEGGTGGGSDGNFSAALGIPTLDGLGALGDGAHALHEHVLVDALVPRAALLAGLLSRLVQNA